MFELPFSGTRVDYFEGNSTSSGTHWIPWHKPQGCSYVNILLVGRGGAGGTGVVGANSTAAGGGGGASGSQTQVDIPAYLLPDTIYINLPSSSTVATQPAYVSVYPTTTSNHVIAYAASGGNGGNGALAVAGAAGTNGGAANANVMSYGFAYATVVAGQNGIIGGTTVSAAALTLPLLGLVVTGGGGGGGLPAAATAGTNGSSFTVPGTPSLFPAHAGGQGSATATLPAASGLNGYSNFNKILYGYGGTGGASTHGTATGGGLVQSSGGRGAPGCGGGGMGGALSGSTPGVQALGGPAFCYIMSS